MQEIFALLCHNDIDPEVSLENYLVYSHLKRIGYVVLRTRNKHITAKSQKQTKEIVKTTKIVNNNNNNNNANNNNNNNNNNNINNNNNNNNNINNNINNNNIYNNNINNNLNLNNNNSNLNNNNSNLNKIDDVMDVNVNNQIISNNEIITSKKNSYRGWWEISEFSPQNRFIPIEIDQIPHFHNFSSYSDLQIFKTHSLNTNFVVAKQFREETPSKKQKLNLEKNEFDSKQPPKRKNCNCIDIVYDIFPTQGFKKSNLSNQQPPFRIAISTK